MAVTHMLLLRIFCIFASYKYLTSGSEDYKGTLGAGPWEFAILMALKKLANTVIYTGILVLW